AFARCGGSSGADDRSGSNMMVQASKTGLGERAPLTAWRVAVASPASSSIRRRVRPGLATRPVPGRATFCGLRGDCHGRARPFVRPRSRRWFDDETDRPPDSRRPTQEIEPPMDAIFKTIGDAFGAVLGNPGVALTIRIAAAYVIV